MSDAPQRVVGLFDQHFPETISAFYNTAKPQALTPVLRFLKDFKPHIVVHGGDQLDLSCISHWNRGKPLLVEGKRLHADYAGYNRLLDRIESLSHPREVVYLTGNHDDWINQLITEQPQLQGLIEWQKHLHLDKRGYKVVPRRKSHKIGKLHFLHGDYKDKYVPQYHAKDIAHLYNRNIVYGHFHTHQEHVKVSPVDRHPITAISIGTLSHLNPVWLRNAANAWVNSFFVAYIHPNGNFNAYRVTISQGTFVFDGQLYR